MTALHDPGSMVISEDIAQKYLGITQGGYQKALGQRLSIKRNNTEYLFTISGIMQNIPDNSSLQMDFVIYFENFENGKLRIGSN
ncbi:MAG TPA: hypothetical protein DIT99_24575, partial [Candidatus Latescibacteria bacterium]|nr:hypothetical protein [Candidatus Latescibacterota bacterium]